MHSDSAKSFARAIALLCVVSIMLVGTACEAPPRERDPWSADTVDLRVRSSHAQVAAGEIVTLSASTRNTLGREARLEWEAPGGRLTVEEHGRIARVQYDHPGTYAVHARLYVDEELRRTDTALIRVRALQAAQ